jgi:hypothetical protein
VLSFIVPSCVMREGSKHRASGAAVAMGPASTAIALALATATMGGALDADAATDSEGSREQFQRQRTTTQRFTRMETLERSAHVIGADISLGRP